EEKESVEKHLATCAYCVSKLAEIDRVVHSLKTMPRGAMPQGLSAKLDSMIDSATAGTASGAAAGGANVLPMRSRLFLPLTAAAAVVALVVGVKFLVPSNRPPVTAHIEKINAPQVANQPAAEQIKPQATVVASGEKPLKPKANMVAAAESPLRPTPAPHAVRAGSVVALLAPEHPKMHAKPVAAVQQPQQVAVNDNTQAPEVQVAELPNGTNSFNEAVGIATDEDGLY